MTQADKDNMHNIFVDIRNDRKAGLDKLFKQYRRQLYGISYSILKNKDDAEEVLQTVLLKLMKIDNELLPNQNEWSWIYSVMKNTSINYLRKNKSTFDIDEIYNISSEDDDIEKVIDKDKFNRMIAPLNDDEKEIVSLKILSELSFSEIADIKDTPEGTVKWKYYKALNTVKSMIGSILILCASVALYLRPQSKPDIVNVVIDENWVLDRFKNMIPTSPISILLFIIAMISLVSSLYFIREFIRRKTGKNNSKNSLFHGAALTVAFVVIILMGINICKLKDDNERLLDELFETNIQCQDLNKTIYELQQENESLRNSLENTNSSEIIMDDSMVLIEPDTEEHNIEESDSNELYLVVPGETQ